ncbi:MAG: SH3 domain-containing protein [Alphaproteobacteria bacterium]|nr:SH3 domain-containing protein [Alphaproteobacteria bacterium]
MAFSKCLVGCFLLAAICSCYSVKNQFDSNGLIIRHESGKCIIDESSDSVLDVPQDLKFFASQIDGQKFMLRQKELDKEFDKRFFSPWTDEPKKISPESFTGDYYCENLHKLSQKDAEYIKSNIKNGVLIEKKGIIIKNTLQKIWPTDSQLFENLKNPGDSYPFDINIQSLVHLGTPVRIMLISKDGLWAFVSWYAYSGWVSMHDVAYVDEQFIETYISHPKVVAVRDATTIMYKDRFLNRADIGTVLPGDGKHVQCPYKNFDGFAKLISCNAQGFTKKPFEFTSENVIKITEQFLGQKYGWGGYLNLRDCSSLTMDYCTIFGIPSERNARSQLFSGTHENLKENKALVILKKGKPFLTLVGSKGHVMLYVGQYEGKPVFLHNIWGAPKKPGQMSRYVIGKTILTTSDFGKNIEETGNSKLENIIAVMKFL